LSPTVRGGFFAGRGGGRRRGNSTLGSAPGGLWRIGSLAAGEFDPAGEGRPLHRAIIRWCPLPPRSFHQRRIDGSVLRRVGLLRQDGQGQCSRQEEEGNLEEWRHGNPVRFTATIGSGCRFIHSRSAMRDEKEIACMPRRHPGAPGISKANRH
jgi:hypothetical protein